MLAALQPMAIAVVRKSENLIACGLLVARYPLPKVPRVDAVLGGKGLKLTCLVCVSSVQIIAVE